VLSAAPLLPVEFVDRTYQAAENGFAIQGPCPFEDVPQGLNGIFTSWLGRADPFLSHSGS